MCEIGLFYIAGRQNMKLYKVARKDIEIRWDNWDEFLGAVIAATSSKEAKEIMISLSCETKHKGLEWQCTVIADEAKSNIKKGTVLTSFRHG